MKLWLKNVANELRVGMAVGAIFFTCTIFAAAILSGCSDPTEKLRQQAIKEYPEFWRQPEQIASVRRTHNIPADYEFWSLNLTGGVWDEKAHYGIYEWTFRFIKKPASKPGDSKTNNGGFVSIIQAVKNPPQDFLAIDVKHICYYDSDSVVPFAVKEAKTSWVNSSIKESKVRFLGDNNYR